MTITGIQFASNETEIKLPESFNSNMCRVREKQIVIIGY